MFPIFTSVNSIPIFKNLNISQVQYSKIQISANFLFKGALLLLHTMLKMHFASTCCANNLHTAKETERGRHLTNMQTLSGKTLLECCVYLCTYSILGSSHLYRPLNHSSDFVLCGLWPLRPRDSRLLWARLNSEICRLMHITQGFQQPL